MPTTPRIKETLRAAKKLKFLEVYAKCGIVQPACTAAGIGRTTYKRWRYGEGEEHQPDPDFVIACQDAYEAAVDEGEMELRERGIHGTEEPVLFRGEPVWKRDPNTGDVLLDDNFNAVPFTIRRRSDRLLELYTKAHRPQYKEKSEVALTGADGGAVKTEHTVTYVLPPGKTEKDYKEDKPFDPLED